MAYLRAGTRVKWQARVVTRIPSGFTGGDIDDFKARLVSMGWRDVAVNRYGTIWQGVIVQATSPIDFGDIEDVRNLFSGVARHFYTWVSSSPSENMIWIDGAPVSTASGVESVSEGFFKQSGEAAGAVIKATEEGVKSNLPLIIVAAVVLIWWRRNQ